VIPIAAGLAMGSGATLGACAAGPARRLGESSGKRMEIVGGLMLFRIGVPLSSPNSFGIIGSVDRLENSLRGFDPHF
jgi:hypothetical protein